MVYIPYRSLTEALHTQNSSPVVSFKFAAEALGHGFGG